MKPAASIRFLLLAALLALVAAGCATPNVNPPAARAHTGYVDFHAGATNDLYWQVERCDAGAQAFKMVYSKFAPPAGGFVRLAFAPGHYQLRVTILNRAVREPGLVAVEIQDGLVTPVDVRLLPDGVTLVQHKENRVGAIAGSGYGMRTKYSSTESTLFQLALEAEPSTPYRMKEQTSYAR
jgi:hypothetical protein